MSNATRTAPAQVDEWTFLRGRLQECMARHGNLHVASRCGHCARPTWCSRCERDDFESPADTLVFTGATWMCPDCIDAIEPVSADREYSEVDLASAAAE